MTIRPLPTPRNDPNVTDYRSGRPRADDAVHDDAIGLLASGHNATLTYGPDGERRGEGMRVFVWAFAPKPRMLVFGAIDFAAAVARVGAFLGYHVTVCDARPVFATTSRFPEADEVVVDWPHRYLEAERDAGRIDGRTVIAVLTHDPKFDVPLLEVALRLPEVAYVGAMGSRRTHDDRLARLREAGLTEEEIDRLSSPIGLDLGARTPEETAICIAAEIVAAAVGRLGRPAGSARRTHPPLSGASLSRTSADPKTASKPLPHGLRGRTSVAPGGLRRNARMHVEDADLQHRRLEAVRAWTAFVEHGDGARAPGPAGDLHQLGALRRRDHPRRRAGAAGRRGRVRGVLARLAAADRGLSAWRTSCDVRPRTATSCSP